MSTTTEVRDVRQQMENIRRGLPDEVDGIVDTARLLVDWRHYVRSAPWPTLGAVAFAGYMAVPRRLEVSSPDVKTLEKLARKNELVVTQRPEATTRPSVIDTFVSLTGNMLMRAALAYVGQQVGKFVGQQASEVGPPEEVRAR
ncbi:MAG: hypothetical protein R3C99_23315 [Pirellulaceae bacterium]